jgi:cyclopropane fatty-acyl-phospholipid synthase-like methyltransferase
MTSRNLLFRTFYRLGFVPWDGHPLPESLRGLIEGDRALPPGAALDIGCGTGDSCIYLAEHGWQVTGVDFVPTALRTAQSKATAAGVTARFISADVTHLTDTGLGRDFGLIVDSGCLHGLNSDNRDAYVREVTAVAAGGTKLLVLAFVRGAMFGVTGIDPSEIERRFTSDWTLLSAGHEAAFDSAGKAPGRYYLFERRDT